MTITGETKTRSKKGSVRRSWSRIRSVSTRNSEITLSHPEKNISTAADLYLVNSLEEFVRNNRGKEKL